MHEDIIRYSLDGETTDANMSSHKEQLVSFLEAQMKDDGVVPSLDLDPGWTLDYNPETENFNFKLSVYGVYIGREGDLWGTAGVMNGKKIMKSTPLARLREF